MADRKNPAPVLPYTDLYLEALAFHESGHAVMCVLLDIPILKVVIGPACERPDDNGRVHIDFERKNGEVPVYKAALLCVASEASEKLSPRFDEFKTLGKRDPNSGTFRQGVRNDLIQGFGAVMINYKLQGLAESTAKAAFKREYRDVAAKIITLNADAVVRFARVLETLYAVAGEEAERIILEQGPLQDGGLLDEF